MASSSSPKIFVTDVTITGRIAYSLTSTFASEPLPQTPMTTPPAASTRRNRLQYKRRPPRSLVQSMSDWRYAILSYLSAESKTAATMKVSPLSCAVGKSLYPWAHMCLLRERQTLGWHTCCKVDSASARLSW